MKKGEQNTEKRSAAQLTRARVNVSELKGILPKPKKAATIEEMNEAIKISACERVMLGKREE